MTAKEFALRRVQPSLRSYSCGKLPSSAKAEWHILSRSVVSPDDRQLGPPASGQWLCWSSLDSEYHMPKKSGLLEWLYIIMLWIACSIWKIIEKLLILMLLDSIDKILRKYCTLPHKTRRMEKILACESTEHCKVAGFSSWNHKFIFILKTICFWREAWYPLVDG